MLKYYQVFISSASNGLGEIRERIIKEIIKQDKYFPIAMEFMKAESSTFEMLFRYMKRSDICILIIGDNAGSLIGDSSKYIKNPEMIKALDEYKSLCGISETGDLTYTEFEVAMAKYLDVKIIPFIKETVINYCEKNNTNEPLTRIYSVVRSLAMFNKWIDEPLALDVVNSLNTCVDTHPEMAGWIREKESAIYKSAVNAGIIDINLNGFLSVDKLEKWLSNSTSLKLCYTTGKAFVNNNVQLLSEFVSKGGSIKLLCCRPYSQALKDVQYVEEKLYQDRSMIHEEFTDVYTQLKNIYNLAKKKSMSSETGAIGKIEIGYLSTLFRSSFLILEDSVNNKSVGWFTVTLPPAKSKDTISFEIKSNDDNNNILERCVNYFETVMDYARSRGESFTVPHSGDIDPINDLDNDDSWKKYWYDKAFEVTKNHKKRKRRKGILIEVAAQHPLDDGMYPNSEFKARLDRAIQLYKEKIQEGFEVEIYVPGSLHLDFDGVVDECSLSSAGNTYLVENGIPKDCIHGDDLNNLYDNERVHKGVYNTGDECYVASKYFMEKSDLFKDLYSICSPNQLMRKTLFYYENGVSPMIVTVPTDNMYHNFFRELFECIPNLLTEDHNYQSLSSKEAIRTRKERMPEYQEI